MTNPAPADDITLPALPGSYEGESVDDGRHYQSVEREELKAWGRAAVEMNRARSAKALAAWPRDAVEVRAFFDPHCEVVQYAIDVKTPAEGDRYQLTAHDFLSAINWWADYHATPATSPVPAAVDVGAAQAETAQAAPVVLPLTAAQVGELVDQVGYSTAEDRANFINGIRWGERAHGIATPGATHANN